MPAPNGPTGRPRAAAARGVKTPPISAFAASPPKKGHGLLLGYAAFTEEEIEGGVVGLARALG